MIEKPYLGFGLGLRKEHYETILSEKPPIDWFEILTENYLVPGGKPLHFLDRICEHYPVVMHGVSLSIGSCDPLDWDYLKQVKALQQRVNPHWISDHLCWTGIEGKNSHDLLPLPFTEEAIAHITNRLIQVQDFFEQRILMENISSYFQAPQSEMTEWEFLSEIAKRADCLILLDINNIYINSINHQYDPEKFISSMPSERVWQIHLAGHVNTGEFLLDTHDQNILPPVWELYAKALKQFGKVSTMIERDDNIPALAELLTELNMARKLVDSICS